MITRTIAFALALTPLAAHAWDPGGHMLVNEVAWQNTKPSTREKVAALLVQLENKFNAGHPYNFVTAGCWMDDMRALGKEYQWAKMHYVTIPWTASGSPAPIPGPPNIVAAIEECRATLRDPQATSEKRVEATAMIVHFVGDIHQPLHATDRNNDRGGNGYLIAGIPFSDLMERQIANLHTFWDKAYRFDSVDEKIAEVWKCPETAGRSTAPGEGIIAEQAKLIMITYPRQGFATEIADHGDATAWAQESHVIGCKSAYPAGDPPPNTEVRALTPDFVKASRVIAERQIALAGYRLAVLLNELFPESPAPEKAP